MQPIESAGSNTPPSVGHQQVTLKLHDTSRYAQFTPSQHLLLVSDGRTITRLELSYSSSRLLELLISRAGLIVDREEMFAFGWPGRVVGQNSLNQAISNIRELLGDDEQRTIIQTVPRRGYRFNSAHLDEDRDEFSASKGAEQACGVMTDSADDAVLPEQTQVSYSFHRLSRFTNHLLAALVVVLAVTLAWRIDWSLWLQQGMYSASETLGELDVQYISESPQELLQLQTDVQPLRDRLLTFVKNPETVIFNKMHGFYEIVCIDQGKSVQFITVHKSRLSQLTDEQLNRCIN
ncbi:winged helix-turn-helix domain-containing protein [Pseudomonas fluorescens]|uniref:winged helix-turn-helix domain-containing protein n=1 Tax=Pseudomonas fluorescens TaxID=294 RepID=UPI001906F68B|nr:winged helix-turn-helix domain-containing protein [Pseudomonas fluorescens]MBD8093294.1 winged helix-turn-helix domain-containing protein [Pseudomonas fluorescens]MBD8719247.1 winged helix-turn-helix domain-containing protein [Pseudomonas fluorescens]